MRDFISVKSVCMLMLAVSLACLPGPPASGAGPRPDVPIGPADQPLMSEGHPPRLTPPVQPPDARPVAYECPRTKYIDCMPPIQGKARELCAPQYLEWVKSHCPGVEVVY